MTRAEEIAERLGEVRARIVQAARRAGREVDSVTLLAVTKTKPLEDALAAHTSGVRHFGENRVQEAEAKFGSLPKDAVRHVIGPVQSNKANRAARIAHVVETIDSADLARRLARAAEAEGKRLQVFVEVNVGGETSKAGVTPEEAPALVDAVRALPALDLAGLMTIPPPGSGRAPFARLRELARGLGLAGLSMGMSDDFEEAILEGSTLVRIGSAIFGPRA